MRLIFKMHLSNKIQCISRYKKKKKNQHYSQIQAPGPWVQRTINISSNISMCFIHFLNSSKCLSSGNFFITPLRCCCEFSFSYRTNPNHNIKPKLEPRSGLRLWLGLSPKPKPWQDENVLRTLKPATFFGSPFPAPFKLYVEI